MPWNRPSLKQLYERIARDFSARLQEGRDLVSQSVEAVLGKVWAGAVNTSHTFLGWIFRMCMIDTSEGVYLDRWGMVWNFPRTEAVSASGQGQFGASGNEAVIPAGWLFVGPDGQNLMAVADAKVENGLIDIELEALEPGLAGNMPAGSAISMARPINGVQSSGFAPAGLTGGVDRESDDDYKARLFARLRQTPKGGSKSDYENWAKEVAGVTRAWCYPLYQGLGTVGLTFVTDNGLDGPIPSDDMIARVDAHIRPLIPANVWNFTVFAPSIKEVPIVLAIKPDTEATREATRAALKNFETTAARPDTTILLTQIGRAVPASVTDYKLVQPSAAVLVDKAEFPVFAVNFAEWPTGENGNG